MSEDSASSVRDRSAVVAAFYGGARHEIVARIGLRDRALSLYLGAISLIPSIVAAAYAFLGAQRAADAQTIREIASYLLLLVPVLAYACALIVSQHNTIVGAIEAYLANEFEPKLEAARLLPPHWDNSETLAGTKAYSIGARTWSHLTIIVGPSALMCLIFLLLHGAGPSLGTAGACGLNPDCIRAAMRDANLRIDPVALGAWVIAAFSTVMSAGAILQSHSQRMKLAKTFIPRLR